MRLSSRDRKILMSLIPAVLIVAYWFLLIAPKRQEAAKVQNDLVQAQGERDTAAQKLAQLSTAKNSFATDYETVIRLGKSIPASLDMPSLLAQLDSAARGTGITFTSITNGQRSGAPTAAAPSSPSATGSGTAPNAIGAAKGAAGASTPPSAAGTSAAGGSTAASSVQGLESIPLSLQFDGNFFHLADFLHHLKRFVQVANNQIQVNGRLIIINNFTFDSGTNFPSITAKADATVYLVPKAEGITAGASPSGPRSAGSPTPAQQPTATSPTPTAATVPR